MNVSDSIDPDALSDVIFGYANAQRGSNQLWDFLISKFLEGEESASINSKILVLRSLITVDYYNKVVFEKIAQNILNKETLENSVKIKLNFLEHNGLFI